MKRSFILGVAIMLGICMVGMASAAIINQPVPDNAYIAKDGYDIAWANPVDNLSYLDLSYQSQFGWKVMTLELFNQLSITATDFIKTGANVDVITGNNLDEVSGATLHYWDGTYSNGIAATGDVAIAVPYFSISFVWADWNDGANGLWNVYDPTGVNWVNETLVYREHSVPEPATMLLLGSGLIGLVGFRRKLRK